MFNNKLFKKVSLTTSALSVLMTGGVVVGSVIAPIVIPQPTEAAAGYRLRVAKADFDTIKNRVAADHRTAFNVGKADFLAANPAVVPNDLGNIVNGIADVAALADLVPVGDGVAQAAAINTLAPYVARASANIAVAKNGRKINGNPDIDDILLANITVAEVGAVHAALVGDIGANHLSKARIDALVAGPLAVDPVDDVAVTHTKIEAIKAIKSAAEARVALGKAKAAFAALPDMAAAAAAADAAKADAAFAKGKADFLADHPLHGDWWENTLHIIVSGVADRAAIAGVVPERRAGPTSGRAQTVAIRALAPYVARASAEAALAKHKGKITGNGAIDNPLLATVTAADVGAANAAVIGIDAGDPLTQAKINAFAIAPGDTVDVAAAKTAAIKAIKNAAEDKVMLAANAAFAAVDVDAARVAANADLLRVTDLANAGAGNFAGRNVQVQAIADRRLAAGGAPAVFNIAAALAPGGGGIAAMDLPTVTTYRAQLALLEAAVNEDKAKVAANADLLRVTDLATAGGAGDFAGRNVQVQEIADRRLTAAAGGAAVFNIAAALAPGGGGIAAMDLPTVTTYRAQLALLEAAVNEDKAKEFKAVAKAARKSNGDVDKENAKVVALFVTEAALHGNPDFAALGGTPAARRAAIKAMGKRDNAAIALLTPAQLKLHNEVMTEYHRQVGIAFAAVDVDAAKAAADADFARVQGLADADGVVGNFNGRNAQVQVIADRRNGAVFDIAAALAPGGGDIAAMDLPTVTTYRAQLELLEAAVNEDKAKEFRPLAKAARESGGVGAKDRAKEVARQGARVVAEATLRGDLAFLALGATEADRRAAIKAMGKRDNAAIALLTPAQLKLHNEVMTEYHRQVGIAFAAVDVDAARLAANADLVRVTDLADAGAGNFDGREVQVQEIADRRLTAAAGAAAVFDIAGVLGGGGAIGGMPNVAAANAYRAQLALLEAAVNEDKAKEFKAVAKAARKSGGNAAKEAAKVAARVVAEATLRGDLAFLALGATEADRRAAIKAMGKRDAGAIEALTPEELKLHNQVMTEYHRQVGIRFAAVDLGAAKAAANADLLRVTDLANAGAGNFDGREVQVQEIADRRNGAVFDIAAALAPGGGDIAAMDLPTVTTYRAQLELLEAAVNEDKAKEFRPLAKAARESGGVGAKDRAKEVARQGARVVAEATLRGDLAFLALGATEADRRAAIKAMGKRDNAAIALLTPAQLKLHNEVMTEYHRQVGIAFAAVDVDAARLAANADFARVQGLADADGVVGNFNGRNAQVQAIANRRNGAVFDIAAALGGGIAAMDLPAANAYRAQLALLEAAVNEDKAKEFKAVAKAARKSGGNAAKEAAKVAARAATEAALRGDLAFLALGATEADRRAAIKAMGKRDAGAIEALTPAQLKLHNEVMTEYHRRVGIAFAAVDVDAARVAANADLLRVTDLANAGAGNFAGRNVQVQAIADRRLAAGGAPAVFNIAAALAPGGGGIAAMDLPTVTTYRAQLALLEAAVNEDKAKVAANADLLRVTDLATAGGAGDFDGREVEVQAIADRRNGGAFDIGATLGVGGGDIAAMDLPTVTTYRAQLALLEAAVNEDKATEFKAVAKAARKSAGDVNKEAAKVAARVATEAALRAVPAFAALGGTPAARQAAIKAMGKLNAANIEALTPAQLKLHNQVMTEYHRQVGDHFAAVDLGAAKAAANADFARVQGLADAGAGHNFDGREVQVQAIANRRLTAAAGAAAVFDIAGVLGGGGAIGGMPNVAAANAYRAQLALLEAAVNEDKAKEFKAVAKAARKSAGDVNKENAKVAALAATEAALRAVPAFVALGGDPADRQDAIKAMSKLNAANIEALTPAQLKLHNQVMTEYHRQVGDHFAVVDLGAAKAAADADFARVQGLADAGGAGNFAGRNVQVQAIANRRLTAAAGAAAVFDIAGVLGGGGAIGGMPNVAAVAAYRDQLALLEAAVNEDKAKEFKAVAKAARKSAGDVDKENAKVAARVATEVALRAVPAFVALGGDPADRRAAIKAMGKRDAGAIEALTPAQLKLHNQVMTEYHRRVGIRFAAVDLGAARVAANDDLLRVTDLANAGAGRNFDGREVQVQEIADRRLTAAAGAAAVFDIAGVLGGGGAIGGMPNVAAANAYRAQLALLEAAVNEDKAKEFKAVAKAARKSGGNAAKEAAKVAARVVAEATLRGDLAFLALGATEADRRAAIKAMGKRDAGAIEALTPEELKLHNQVMTEYHRQVGIRFAAVDLGAAKAAANADLLRVTDLANAGAGNFDGREVQVQEIADRRLTAAAGAAAVFDIAGVLGGGGAIGGMPNVAAVAAYRDQLALLEAAVNEDKAKEFKAVAKAARKSAGDVNKENAKVAALAATEAALRAVPAFVALGGDPADRRAAIKAMGKLNAANIEALTPEELKLHNQVMTEYNRQVGDHFAAVDLGAAKAAANADLVRVTDLADAGAGHNFDGREVQVQAIANRRLTAAAGAAAVFDIAGVLGGGGAIGGMPNVAAVAAYRDQLALLEAAVNEDKAKEFKAVAKAARKSAGDVNKENAKVAALAATEAALRAVPAFVALGGDPADRRAAIKAMGKLNAANIEALTPEELKLHNQVMTEYHRQVGDHFAAVDLGAAKAAANADLVRVTDLADAGAGHNFDGREVQVQAIANRRLTAAAGAAAVFDIAGVLGGGGAIGGMPNVAAVAAYRDQLALLEAAVNEDKAKEFKAVAKAARKSAGDVNKENAKVAALAATEAALRAVPAFVALGGDPADRQDAIKAMGKLNAANIEALTPAQLKLHNQVMTEYHRQVGDHFAVVDLGAAKAAADADFARVQGLADAGGAGNFAGRNVQVQAIANRRLTAAAGAAAVFDIAGVLGGGGAIGGMPNVAAVAAYRDQLALLEAAVNEDKAKEFKAVAKAARKSAGDVNKENAKVAALAATEAALRAVPAFVALGGDPADRQDAIKAMGKLNAANIEALTPAQLKLHNQVMTEYHRQVGDHFAVVDLGAAKAAADADLLRVTDLANAGGAGNFAGRNVQVQAIANRRLTAAAGAAAVFDIAGVLGGGGAIGGMPNVAAVAAYRDQLALLEAAVNEDKAKEFKAVAKAARKSGVNAAKEAAKVAALAATEAALRAVPAFVALGGDPADRQAAIKAMGKLNAANIEALTPEELKLHNQVMTEYHRQVGDHFAAVDLGAAKAAANADLVRVTDLADAGAGNFDGREVQVQAIANRRLTAAAGAAAVFDIAGVLGGGGAIGGMPNVAAANAYRAQLALLEAAVNEDKAKEFKAVAKAARKSAGDVNKENAKVAALAATEAALRGDLAFLALGGDPADRRAAIKAMGKLNAANIEALTPAQLKLHNQVMTEYHRQVGDHFAVVDLGAAKAAADADFARVQGLADAGGAGNFAGRNVQVQAIANRRLTAAAGAAAVFDIAGVLGGGGAIGGMPNVAAANAYRAQLALLEAAVNEDKAKEFKAVAKAARKSAGDVNKENAKVAALAATEAALRGDLAFLALGGDPADRRAAIKAMGKLNAANIEALTPAQLKLHNQVMTEYHRQVGDHFAVVDLGAAKAAADADLLRVTDLANAGGAGNFAGRNVQVQAIANRRLTAAAGAAAVFDIAGVLGGGGAIGGMPNVAAVAAYRDQLALLEAAVNEDKAKEFKAVAKAARKSGVNAAKEAAKVAALAATEAALRAVPAFVALGGDPADRQAAIKAMGKLNAANIEALTPEELKLHNQVMTEYHRQVGDHFAAVDLGAAKAAANADLVRVTDLADAGAGNFDGREVQVQAIANRRLTAAAGAAAVFDIAGVLGGGGAIGGMPNVAAANAYRAQLALLEAAVNEDKAKEFKAVAKAARKSAGDVNKENAKVAALAATEAALRAVPAFVALGGDPADRQDAIKAMGKLNAANIEALTPAQLKLHNQVMTEYHRQVGDHFAAVDLGAAKAAANADLVRVTDLADAGAGHNFDGREVQVQAIANRRLTAAAGAAAVFDIAGVLGGGGAIGGMPNVAAVAAYRDQLALLEAAVNEDKAKEFKAVAKAARKSAGDVNKENAKVAALAATEAALRAVPAFVALGGDPADRRAAIKAMGKLNAANIEALTPEELKLHNQVMTEYHRQVGDHFAAVDLGAAKAAANADLVRVTDLADAGAGHNFDGREVQVQAIANRRLTAAAGAAAVFDIAGVLGGGGAIGGMPNVAAVAAYRDQLALLEAAVNEDKAKEFKAVAKAARKSAGDVNKENAKVAALAATEAALRAVPAFVALGGDPADRQDAIKAMGKLNAANIEALTPAQLKLHNQVMTEYHRQVGDHFAAVDLGAAKAAANADLVRVTDLADAGAGNFDGREVQVQAIANRRLTAAAGAAAVFDIAGVLGGGGAIGGMPNVAAANAYRAQLALLEAAVNEDKAKEFKAVAKAARKSNGNAAKEAAKVAARAATEVALHGNPDFVALGATPADRRAAIKAMGKLNAANIEALTPAQLKLHNEVMTEYHRQVGDHFAAVDLGAAKAAADADFARVQGLADAGAGHNFDGREVQVQAIANRRLTAAAGAAAVFDIAGVLGGGGAIGGMPNVAAANAYRAQLALLEAAVNEDKAKEFKAVAKAARKSNGNAAKEAAKVAALAATEAALRAVPAFVALGATPAARQDAIKAMGKLNAANIEALTPAQLKLHNQVMTEYNRQVGDHFAAVAAAHHPHAPAAVAVGAPAEGGRAQENVAAASAAVTKARTETINHVSEDEGNYDEVARILGDTEEGKQMLDDAMRGALSQAHAEKVTAAIAVSKELSEVRTAAWTDIGVAKENIATATPAQHVQFVAALEKAPKMHDEIVALSQKTIKDPTKVENIEKAVIDLKKLTRTDSVEKLAAAASDDATASSANQAVQSLLYSAAIATKYSTAEEREAAVTKTVAQAQHKTVSNHVYAAVSNVVSRIDAVGFTVTAPLADSDLGASAGDEDSSITKAGGWIGGIFGTSKQDKDRGRVGYKGGLAGGTLGADIELNDSVILGGAYSHILSDFKYKDGRAGDKTNVRSHVVSIYAQASLDENFVWHNIVSLSKSNVTNKNQRHGAVASSKFKSTGVNVEANLGYRIAQDNMTFVPNVGLRYGHFKDGGYKESGAGVHNIHASSSSNNVLTGILGAKVMWNTQVDELAVTPHLHASVEQNLSSKNGKVKAKFAWMNDYFASTAETGNKPPKTAYNVGAGVAMRKGNIELGVDYNLNMMKKYQSHQGSVKLKVVF